MPIFENIYKGPPYARIRIHGYRYGRPHVQRAPLYTAAFMLSENLIIRYLINGYTLSILRHSTIEGYHQIYATSEFRFRLQTDHILALP